DRDARLMQRIAVAEVLVAAGGGCRLTVRQRDATASGLEQGHRGEVGAAAVVGEHGGELQARKVASHDDSGQAHLAELCGIEVPAQVEDAAYGGVGED